MRLRKIFIYLLFLLFLLGRGSNEDGWPVSGKIGDATFTILACIFTIFSLKR